MEEIQESRLNENEKNVKKKLFKNLNIFEDERSQNQF